MSKTTDGLEHSDQPFRALFESSPDAIFIEDLDGYVIACNPAAVRLHETTREKLLGRHVSELVPPERRQEVVTYSMPAPVEFEGFSLTDTGRSVPVSVRISRVKYRGKPAMLLHVRDVTEQRRLREELEERVRSRTADLEHANEILREEMEERSRAERDRRRLEEEIRTVQKMEAIGRLAGGVAHDFNNLLTVIIGRCDRLLDKLEPNHPALGDVHLIHESATKAASVTRQLLAFGRKQVLHLRMLDLNVVIRSMDTLLRSLISEDIEFVLNLDPSPCGV